MQKLQPEVFYTNCEVSLSLVPFELRTPDHISSSSRITGIAYFVF